MTTALLAIACLLLGTAFGVVIGFLLAPRNREAPEQKPFVQVVIDFDHRSVVRTDMTVDLPQLEKLVAATGRYMVRMPSLRPQ